MQYKTLDMEHYPRRAHFDYFRSMDYPYVGVTVPVDITAFHAALQREGHPFFLSFVYCVAKAANSVVQLRQRILENGIVEYPFCKTSHTVLRPDGTYAYCDLDPTLPFPQFLSEGIARQEKARIDGTLDDGADGLNLLFLSCVPWLEYTSLIQPVPTPADSNPRITWGKFSRSGERLTLPVSILANHALVDGLHLAAFYERLEAELAAFAR